MDLRVTWFVQLVKFMIFKSDLDAQTIFLYTYSQYAIPEELFLAAEDLYLTSALDLVKLAKLAAFLHLWIAKEEEFDRKLMRKVLELARLYTPPDPDLCTKEAKRYRILTGPSQESNKYRRSVSQPLGPCPRIGDSPRYPDSPRYQDSPRPSHSLLDVRYSLVFHQLVEPYKVDILKHSTSLLAKQLTLIDHELTCSLKMCDLRSKILHPEQRKCESLTEVADRFNQVSFWVATQIVIAKSPRTRVEIMEKFINLASKMLQYNNFSGVMQIVSGLNNANIRRLRSAWKCVSQKSIQTLHRVEIAMSHVGNYTQYRTTIRDCQTKQIPSVPLICLLLQDLTFINDGNEDLSLDGKVNFEKWTLFGSCMLNFSKLIEKKYTFHKNHSIRKMLWEDLLVLPETLIMKHSYAIEARRRTPCTTCPSSNSI
jgi:hypothetical protein